MLDDRWTAETTGASAVSELATAGRPFLPLPMSLLLGAPRSSSASSSPGAGAGGGLAERRSFRDGRGNARARAGRAGDGSAAGFPRRERTRYTTSRRIRPMKRYVVKLLRTLLAMGRALRVSVYAPAT